jgi:hypothetical protein
MRVPFSHLFAHDHAAATVSPNVPVQIGSVSIAAGSTFVVTDILIAHLVDRDLEIETDTAGLTTIAGWY